MIDSRLHILLHGDDSQTVRPLRIQSAAETPLGVVLAKAAQVLPGVRAPSSSVWVAASESSEAQEWALERSLAASWRESGLPTRFHLWLERPRPAERPSTPAERPSTPAVPEGRVVMQIDLDSVRDAFRVRRRGGRSWVPRIDWAALRRYAESFGSLVCARGYTSVQGRDALTDEVGRLGIECVRVEGQASEREVRRALDAVALVAEEGATTVVSITGQGASVELAKYLYERGLRVVELPCSPTASCSGNPWHHVHALYRQVVQQFSEVLDDDVTEAGLRHALETLVREHSTPQESGPSTGGRQGEAAPGKGRPGLKGARVKPLLRETFDANFDERTWGFRSMSEMLEHFDDVVELERSPSGGDLIVRPRQIEARPADARTAGVEGSLAGLARDEREPALDESNGTAELPSSDDDLSAHRREVLRSVRFERDPERRRTILMSIFDALSWEETFTWREVKQRLESQAGALVSSQTELSRYQNVFYHAGFFDFVADESEGEGEGPAEGEERARRTAPRIRDRRAILRVECRDFGTFQARYEAAVVERVFPEAQRTRGDIVRLLGYKEADQEPQRSELERVLRQLEAQPSSPSSSHGGAARHGNHRARRGGERPS